VFGLGDVEGPEEKRSGDRVTINFRLQVSNFKFQIAN